MKSSTPPHPTGMTPISTLIIQVLQTKNSHTIDISTEHYLNALIWRELISLYNIIPESNIKVKRIMEMITN